MKMDEMNRFCSIPEPLYSAQRGLWSYLICIVAAICMAFLICVAGSVTSNAEESLTYTDSDGIIWEYEIKPAGSYAGNLIVETDSVEIMGCSQAPENGVLVIPSVIDGMDVISIGNSAFCNEPVQSAIREVIIPGTVVAIQQWAFKGCSNMKKLELAEGVAYLEHGPFIGCGIEELVLPDSIFRMNGSWGAFQGCSSLKKVTLPRGIHIAGAINFAFTECDALVEFAVKEGEEDYVTSDGILYNKDMTRIVAYPCGKTDETFVVPGSIETISQRAFLGSKLQEIQLPEGLKTIGEAAFAGCESLTSIDIPAGVTEIPYACFSQCDELETVGLEEGIASIGEDAFGYCSKLKGFDIPASVRMIGSRAFISDGSITYAVIPEGVTGIDESTFANCYSLEYVSLPDSLISIGVWAFQGHGIYGSAIHDLYIPENVETIDERAFLDCSSELTLYSANQAVSDFASAHGISFVEADRRQYEEITDQVTAYRVIYDANGGAGGPFFQTKTPGQDLTLSSEIPVRNEYIFTGWATSSSAAAAEYQPGDSYSTDYSIKLYAVWRNKNAPFDITGLSYSFGNNRTAFDYPDTYNIPLSSYQIIFGKTTKAKLYYLQGSYKNWGGNCNGISATSALLYDKGNGILPSSFNSNAIVPGDLILSDRFANQGVSLKDFIEAMQISQYTKLFKDARSDSKVYSSQIVKGKDDLNDIYAALNEETMNQRPVILAACQSGAGHALLAYSVEIVSANESRIHVYDSNYPNEDRFFTFTKNPEGDWVGWSYDIGGGYGTWGTDDSSSYLSIITYPVIKEIWSTKGLLEENENIGFFNSKNLTVYDSSDKLVAKVENGQLTASAEGVRIMDEDLVLGSNQDNDTVALTMPVDAYRITNQDESISQFKMTIFDTDLGMEIDTTTKEVLVAVDDSCNLNTVAMDAAAGDTYTVTLNSTNEYDNEEVVVKGKGTGEILEVSQCKGNISISNCQLSSVLINGEEYGTLTVTSSCSSGGTITPIGDTMIPGGGNIEYAIEPEDDFEIKDVLVDGISVGNVSSYEFKNIRTNHHIRAIFEKAPGIKISASNIKRTYSTGTQKCRIGAKVTGRTGAVMTYESNNSKVKVDKDGVITISKKFIGKAVIAINAKAGNSTAVKKITVTVVPARTSIARVKNIKGRKIIVQWKKNPSASGYEIQYSLNSKFTKGKRTVRTKGKSKTNKTIGKLKKGKKYYVRIRAFKTVSGVKYNSEWSTTKKVIVKK